MVKDNGVCPEKTQSDVPRNLQKKGGLKGGVVINFYNIANKVLGDGINLHLKFGCFKNKDHIR